MHICYVKRLKNGVDEVNSFLSQMSLKCYYCYPIPFEYINYSFRYAKLAATTPNNFITRLAATTLQRLTGMTHV